MPSAANFARPIRAWERIDLETCAPGSSHGPPPSFDLPQTWSFHLCGRSASGCQSASEAIGEAPQRWRCVFQERAGHSPCRSPHIPGCRQLRLPFRRLQCFHRGKGKYRRLPQSPFKCLPIAFPSRVVSRPLCRRAGHDMPAPRHFLSRADILDFSEKAGPNSPP